LENKNVYFASDFHLGLAAGTDPREREKRVTAWLRKVSIDASEIYLLGDIFDFWWEYNKVVPKGFTRFLGTISELTDNGIRVHLFTGNHDMWMRNYLIEECGVQIYHYPLLTAIDNKRFYLAHGEGLGTTSLGFKILLAFFHSKIAQRVFSAINPRFGLAFGHAWSRSSRLAKGISLPFLGEDKEDLLKHTRKILNEGCEADFFIYGHRHLAMTFIEKEKKIILLGDWFNSNSYAVWDGKELSLVNQPL
jgi:UDP-2,3-diacylglucosamine hydrolase